MTSLSEIFNRHREAYLYIICGGLTTLVTWASYALFVRAGIELNLSNIMSWFCGILFAFVVNKWIVFSSTSLNATLVLKELGSFLGSRVFTGIIAFVLFAVLLMVGMDQVLFNTKGFVAKIVVTVVEVVLNWFLSKYVVFRKRHSA